MKDAATSLLIGLTAGFLGGLLGVGGGVVMTPLMVGVIGLRQIQAHGTSLLALVFTGIGGAVAYAIRGQVDLPATVSLTLPAVFTARLGARYAHALPEWRLKRAFGAFLLAVTAVLLAKSWLVGPADPMGGAPQAAILLATGGLAGFLSGMLGVGGGSLMVPAMVLLTGFPQALAQGSSLLAMVPVGAAGAHQHWQLGNVVKRILPGLVPGTLAGAWLGSGLAVRLSEGWLRAGFAAVLVQTGVRYLVARPPADGQAHAAGGQ